MSLLLCGNVKPRPTNVGILALDVYFPNMYVNQTDLETADGCQGKYTKGLGQEQMGFCCENEDIQSLCLTVVANLMKKYQIDYTDVGRLEVGTETIIDKSKSVKSVLMKLFEDCGNHDVEGADTTNACYGGTNALFNSIAWVESSHWDGRYALAVCGDIAVYEKGGARCTGGCGAIAMLIGPDSPLILEPGTRCTYSRNTYDFYKPNLTSEYPVVDGKLTLTSYITALDNCYQGYCRKVEQKLNYTENSFSLEDLDYLCFHSPYCKLVQKSVARLLLIDTKRKIPYTTQLTMNAPNVENLQETIGDRNIEKSFMQASSEIFDKKTYKSLMLSKRVGNMYTPSLYACLISLLHRTSLDDLHNKRIGMFSYGSGLIASMFSIISVNRPKQKFNLEKIKNQLSDIEKRLDSRVCFSPNDYTSILERKELLYNKANYTTCEELHSKVSPSSYVLVGVDEAYRRNYVTVASFEKLLTNGVHTS